MDLRETGNAMNVKLRSGNMPIEVSGSSNRIAIIDGQAVELDRVFLLTSGDGTDGHEWQCYSIHRTRESAERAKREFEVERRREDGSIYYYEATIEE